MSDPSRSLLFPKRVSVNLHAITESTMMLEHILLLIVSFSCLSFLTVSFVAVSSFVMSTILSGKLHRMRHTGNGLSFIEADLTKKSSRWHEKHALIASFL